MIPDRIAGWLRDPHPGKERFDEGFVIAMRCSRCGKVGYGPRAQMHEAVSDHWQSPACRALGDGAGLPKMQLFYPRS